jgi:hypothetical protein
MLSGDLCSQERITPRRKIPGENNSQERNAQEEYAPRRELLPGISLLGVILSWEKFSPGKNSLA